jgi:hypothetical protein
MMNAALSEDRNLQNWKREYQNYLQQHPEECKIRFQVTEASVRRDDKV